LTPARRRLKIDFTLMTYQPPMPVAPIPVAPLQWPPAPPPRRGRPGIITAIGIVSIIVACLSGMANFIITFVAFGALTASRSPAMFTPPPRPGQFNTVPAAAPNGATAIVGGVQVDPSQSEDGVHDESQRAMIISGMTRARSLDEGRKKQLDLLLTVAGRNVFPFISPGTSPQTIRANVSDSGRLPSASAGKKGPDYYIVGTGRVEVYDTHAIFRPDGSPNTVSVTMPTDDASGSNDPNAPASNLPPPGTPQPIQPPPVAPIPNPMASINPTAATLSMIAAMLSLLLALYLLIIGIVTLRDSRSGAKLHWAYVAIKIPVVILAIVVNSWLAASFINGLQATAAAAAANSPSGSPPAAQTLTAGAGGVATMWIILLAIAALAYPLSLIIVLLTKTVRRYYSPARDEY
jgi:hypothetical protein